MGLHFILLLAVIALLTSVGATSTAASTPGPLILAHSLADSHPSIRVTRLLRSEGLPSSITEKLKGMVTSSAISQGTFDRWVDNKKSIDNMFVRYGLDTAADDKLLQHPLFITWIKYVKALNANNNGLPGSAISHLTEYYGWERLAKILEEATRVPATKGVAKELQLKQFQVWFELRQSPDDMFKILELRNADNVLENPLIATWMSYLTMFNEKFSERKTTLIETMAKYYDDAAMAKMFEEAMKNPGSMDLAKNIQKDLIQRWLDNDAYPIRVFRLLKLDQGSGNILASPVLNTWTTYLDLFKKKYPNDKSNLVWTLLNTRSESDASMVIAAALKDPRTKSLGAKLEDAQFEKWLRSRLDPSDVFTLLRLNDRWTNIFTSPQFNAWIKYTKRFNKQFTIPLSSPIQVLRAKYLDGSLAAMLILASRDPSSKAIAKEMEVKLITTWVTHYNPNIVFKRLHLDEAPDRLLRNPVLNTWAKFLDEFNAMNPREKTTMIDTFRMRFDDKDLANAIREAKKVPISRDLATDLQQALLNKWVSAKVHPDDVAKILGKSADSKILLKTYVGKFLGIDS